MKRWIAIAVGVLAYFIALMALAPATLIDAGLERATNGRLRLAQAEGTVWSGSGKIEIRDAAGRRGIAKELSWRVLPVSLLRARLVCEVGVGQPASTFPVSVSFSRIEVAKADISLPAAVLGLGVPKLAPLGLTGEVQLRIASVAISRGLMDGTATLQWLAAGSTLTSVSPLGDYELRLDGAGTTIHAYLRTTEGPLFLDGTGSWQQGTNPAFQVEARVAAPQQPQLAPLMRLIAVERGEGKFEIQLN
jgi:general secretion pathway protein N